MSEPLSITRRRLVLGSMAPLLPPVAGAQTVRAAQATLPATLRIIMPFPPGNSLDGAARWFAEAFRGMTGRNAIVENKPGAAATIAAGEVSRAKPDGSVILWTSGGHITTAVLMKRRLYDPIEGFTPLTPVSQGEGFAMVTRSAAPYNSAQDVLDAARKSPGKVSYASAGIGNTTHVIGAMFAKSAGVDLLHVPYRGDPFTDLMSGVVDLAFVGPGVVKPFLDSGKLKALGLSGVKRATSLPNVPTFSEFGVRDVDLPAYSMLLAPPNMMPEVLSALHQNIAMTLRDPALAAKFRSNGSEPWIMTPDAFKVHLKAELQHMRATLPPLGIQMEL
jgi:tripartite-type tricarboxylate transporter receptor subunit TctC